MEVLECDKCSIKYTDKESIAMAKDFQNNWAVQCKRDGTEPRGITPCPVIPCEGELILKEE